MVFRRCTVEKCPACQNEEDYQPNPNGTKGATWLVCQNCGYIQDLEGHVLDEGAPEMQQVKTVENAGKT